MSDKLTTYLQQLRRRTNDPAVLAWGERAATLRYVDDVAAGIVAETCPDCLGVVLGSTAGTRTTRLPNGRFGPNRYRDCECGTRVSVDALVLLHGLRGAFGPGTVAATGQAQD